jgi:hypothetical protein
MNKLLKVILPVVVLLSTVSAREITIVAPDFTYKRGFGTQEFYTPYMEHVDAFKWNINLGHFLTADEEITSATFRIESLLSKENPNIVFIDLLDINTPTTITGPNTLYNFANDNTSGQSDYFARTNSGNGYTNYTRIGTFSDRDPSSWNYHSQNYGFNANQLSTLNSYRSDNNWIGFGLDTDCLYQFYDNFDFRFTITTASRSVPEPATLTMLLCGLSCLGGFAFFRRRK